MKIGNMVSRISYNHDIVFRIIDIKEEAILSGVFQRIIATAPVSDLEIVKENHLKIFRDRDNKQVSNILKYNKRKKGYITGKILQIDGDKEYLDQCLDLYKSVGCYAVGVHINEYDMSKEVLKLIERYNPDIIVITGHDSYNKKGLKEITNYKNSHYFIETIRVIRTKYSKDDKFIIAGACQSHFEALIAIGANFATSPKRVNVHLFDPAIVAIKASTTPFNQIVSIDDIFKFSYIKNDGLGGIESYGKMRILL